MQSERSLCVGVSHLTVQHDRALISRSRAGTRPAQGEEGSVLGELPRP